MKVVLLQDVKKLGKRGDVVEVSDGYGRNVLIKRGLGQKDQGQSGIRRRSGRNPRNSNPRWLLMKRWSWRLS